MQRVRCDPRPNWQKRVEEKGLVFHTTDAGQPYWNESAYYEFSPREVDLLEAATAELYARSLEAVAHVVKNDLWDDFHIPKKYASWVRRSWEEDDRSLYGRFDLLYDGSQPPKLIEFNADTPTALLEAAVIQWFWLEEAHPTADQFNSLHERLIEAFQLFKNDGMTHIAFASCADHIEDYVTANYLRDLAVQAGLVTQYLTMAEVGWNASRRMFVDGKNRPVACMFKLYPWEWMLREVFGTSLPEATTRWIEPPWKMLLSNKALLPLLWKLFPKHPNLLEASWQPLAKPHVRKPIFGREGANIAIIHQGQVLHATEGVYGNEPAIYQEYFPTPRFDGTSFILGSWLVDGEPAGLGIREDDHLITTNSSRFVPHLFR